MLPRHPLKKKIVSGSSQPEPSETASAAKVKVPDSLDASLEAQAAALADSFPETDQVEESAPKKKVKSDLARHRAAQKEIEKLVNQLPNRIREQMEDLFRARFTRIQKLDPENLNADSE